MNGQVQKLTFPTLEKQDYTNANMWWRKFVQYIKKTKDLDLSKMTNNKETLLFIYSCGHSDKMRSRKWPKRLERENQAHFRYTNYTHCFDYTSHRRETFNTAQPISSTSNGKTESPRRMSGNEYTLEFEKNCEFETITAAELLASKFLSVIGKSTGVYDLKKKIRKSDMSIEAITEARHEYMYETLNESETEEEKKIRYLNKRKTEYKRTFGKTDKIKKN